MHHLVFIGLGFFPFFFSFIFSPLVLSLSSSSNSSITLYFSNWAVFISTHRFYILLILLPGGEQVAAGAELPPGFKPQQLVN